MTELKRKDYDALLEPLHEELSGMARWAQATGARVAIVLEGRDTAGKTGVIHAISEKLNPRQVRTVALAKPTERERTQWYFQRYVPHLPAAGEIVLFDRSWYNRAGVETVMGYASDEQVRAFLTQTPAFEKLLTDDGLYLFKYWLCCDQAEQEKRFAERRDDPMKRWKLSPVDLEARAHYDDYTAAREAMLAVTHTPHAPWTLVDFNDQRRGRLTLIRHLLDRLPDTAVPVPPLDLPRLGHPPHAERFGLVEPLRPYPDT
ncbi:MULTISPECIES: polyphosphate kinase 2 [Novosphingobium]|uniref:polyphosphate kinase 2 n=1 Tax=Novosphingobium TaxID=165696 RepID=UPI001CD1F0B3|nr:polyphosphate kinase 2 [Novosphingobium percolationis]